jgi:hypothetical protein
MQWLLWVIPEWRISFQPRNHVGAFLSNVIMQVYKLVEEHERMRGSVQTACLDLLDLAVGKELLLPRKQSSPISFTCVSGNVRTLVAGPSGRAV